MLSFTLRRKTSANTTRFSRYVGLFLATYGAQSNVPATLTFAQNQTARVEKKGVVAAVMYVSQWATG